MAAGFALNPAIRQRIEDGEAFDLVITNPDKVADLVRMGRVTPGSNRPFGRIPMGIGERSGHAPLDVGSISAFTRTMLAASSVAYASEGTSGAYFLGLLERLGIAPVMRPRLVPISGADTATAVVRGEAELAVVPVTSILAAAPEVKLVGLFPGELQSYIDFAVGIAAATEHRVAVGQLARYLLSPAIDGTLAAAGLQRQT